MSDSDENYAAQIDDSLSDSSLDDPPPPEVVEQPKPIVKKKRVQSPAQKAALEKGRATALANRLARKKEKEDALNAKLKEQKNPKEPEPDGAPSTTHFAAAVRDHLRSRHPPANASQSRCDAQIEIVDGRARTI